MFASGLVQSFSSFMIMPTLRCMGSVELYTAQRTSVGVFVTCLYWTCNV